MSSIPSSKMKHAHAHAGNHPEQAQHAAPDAPKVEKKAKAKGPSITERAEHLAEEALDAVKARPKTAAAIGAAIVAGAAAIVGGPAAARALKGDAKKPAAKRPAKKAAKKD